MLVCNVTVAHQAALIDRLRQCGDKLHCGRIEASGIDFVAVKWRAESPRSSLARRRSKCGEVALLHRGRRHIACIERGIGTLNCGLVAAKEEQFVLDNRTAQDSAELVALQRVALGGKEVARVQRPVAQKLEEIAVEFIRSGLRYRINSRPGICSPRDADLGGSAS